MPKEHAGGLDRNGQSTIAVEWQNDEAFAVEITHFDFDSLDSVEARAREALADGLFKAFLEAHVADRLREERGAVASAIVAEVIDAKQPKLKLVCLAIATGMTIGLARTLEEWGKAFGVTKQNMQQLVEAASEKFGLRKNRAMRDEEARENMRNANFRPKEKLAA